ncbi:MAG TPA: sialidase family protein, partial [Chthoniobacterales bacterium]
MAALSLQVRDSIRSPQRKPQPSLVSQREDQRGENPPEDWFITQRVTHGGIPMGAPERAAAQAAALAAESQNANAPQARSRWQFVGPTNIGGRVVDIAVDPVAADTIYVAAATGGIWRSRDKGAQFTSIWPVSNPQSMGALLITPGGTLFAGTGEANPGGGSITYGGGGIYRSSDKGRTWTQVGLANSGAIGLLAGDPTNAQRIFAAAAGPLYNHGGDRGVYESTDGGTT